MTFLSDDRRFRIEKSWLLYSVPYNMYSGLQCVWVLILHSRLDSLDNSMFRGLHFVFHLQPPDIICI